MNTAVYPGSFDPFTNGHRDILERALSVFDRVIIAVARNPSKKPLFTFDERVEIINESMPDTDRVEVRNFHGLLVDFMHKVNSRIIVKGLRAVSDFEFEFQMALMNRKIDPEVETVFLMTSSEYAFLSSSKVREISSLGGPVSCLVSPFAQKKLREKCKICDDKGETVEID
ncbi:MAG: pantetheine-phosphate adenylyltransferase [Candidatus Eremiobacteraeota bacterium]|nr:pantetheine-phosphate adenylyltransferase [Candidatus Eremiobacteraeota bacterium]